MARIIIADLSAGSVTEKNYDFNTEKDFGRGLALRLLREYSPADASQFSSSNAFVITPGLMTGTYTPSATRATAATRGAAAGKLDVGSFTGDTPQKLASLDVAGLVITGISAERNAVLHITESGAELLHEPETQDRKVSECVDYLRGKYGAHCALFGVGKAADMQLPLSGFFTTYPEGSPRFTCPRAGFGSVLGSKGLRAVITDGRSYFNTRCADIDTVRAEAKKLAGAIINDRICGSALPGLGSITILHLLKNKSELPPVPQKRTGGGSADPSAAPAGHINYGCAPGCVIGCLNRHGAGSGEFYAAPEESEVRAALQQCFGIDSFAFAKKVNALAFDMGFNATELIYTIKLYAVAEGLTMDEDRIYSLAAELEKGSLLGRLLGSGSAAIAKFYGERADVQRLVTRSAIHQEKDFDIKLFHPEGTEGLSELELLYREIFILENLGMCIFSSFAVLNAPEPLETLAALASARLGRTLTVKDLLDYSGECIQKELQMQQDAGLSGIRIVIPEFTKVLYRYFA